MLHVTTLRHRSSIRTAAGTVALALLLGLAAPAPASAATPDQHGGTGAWSEPWSQLGSLIARWLGLDPGSLSAGSDHGPGMDPDGLSAGGDDGPDMDPNGIETDGGPDMDPNG